MKQSMYNVMVYVYIYLGTYPAVMAVAPNDSNDGDNVPAGAEEIICIDSLSRYWDLAHVDVGNFNPL
jgi:hypothetical protein